MKLLANLTVALVFLAGHAYAEVKLVREYLLKPPRDKRILFEMAVTPGQDVLAFIASEDREWRLSRVRNWLDKQPVEESLTIPGLATSERREWLDLSTKLFLSPDGRFVVCIASGRRRLPLGDEELVSVVSLDQFRILVNLRASALAQVAGSYRLYHLDRRGYVVVNAVTSSHLGGEWHYAHKLALLSLPGLDVTEQCEYSESSSGKIGSGYRLEGEGTCADLVKNAGAASLQEYLKTFVENDEVLQRDRARPPECAFLTYASYLSGDGRFRRELCTSGHRGFWGNFVVSNARENIFSAATGKQLGSVKEPSSHPLHSRFATMNGRDYLLTMEGGTILRIYEITD